MKNTILLIGFLLSFPLVACAQEYDADAETVAMKKAQQIIDACWAESQDDRDSGVTLRMRQGTTDSVHCMRDHILSLSKNTLFKNNPDMQTEIEESLNAVISDVGRLYWNLNNSHDVCTESPCGTMYTLFHNESVAKVMENILRDFYQKIAEYEYHYQVMDKSGF